MAPPAGTLRVGRYFLVLALLFVLLYAIVFWPGTDHAPKLGLDLRGGAQIIYKAETTSGKTPSSSSMNQAKSIIDQRVNGLGVEQSQVVIQGSDEIVVTVPGKRADQLQDVGKTALLNFRPLISGGYAVSAPAATATPTPSVSGSAASGSTTASPSAAASSSAANSASAAPTSGASGQNYEAKPLAADTTPASSPASSAAATTTPSASASGTAPASGTPIPTASTTAPTLDTTAIGYSALTDAQKTEINNFNCDTPKEDADHNIVVCDTGHTTKYLLGPILVPGTEVSTASASAPNASSGQFQWTVLISLKSSGQKTWSEYTAAHHNADPSTNTNDTVAANFVAFTLDDEVITSPTDIQGTINGDTQVSGNFNQTQANSLANSLKYGALPLKFTAQAASTVSATLGSAQLKAGLLAGGIGLALVVLYSLFYYRALGLVTIASLLVSGGLTYASLVILGSQIGFTLTLAGIAGFIVAVGITADSFVVLFERVKDEVHEGRTMRVAIPRAWVRARRTIISADVVSFLAAAVLYFFAAGDVRGFAFTLGMSTILDLVVVFLFTHPLVSLLSRSAAFGSARFTGLNAVRTGGIAQSAPTAQDRRREVASRRATNAATRRAAAATGTAVLDDDLVDEDFDLDDEPLDDEQVIEVAPVVDDVELSADGDDIDDIDEPDAAPRVHTTPASGTAAERAAARRARLRGTDGKA